MDIRQWRIALIGDMGNSNNQPGLALMLSLKCRGCTNEPEVFYARRIYPEMFANGKPTPEWFGGPFDAGWTSHWFDTFVNQSLAKQRSCDDCGMASIITPRQASALISESNAAMSSEWLRESVAAFEFDTRIIEDNQYHNYRQEVYVAKAGMTAMNWVPFELATLTHASQAT
jgi:hypothetical protein